MQIFQLDNGLASTELAIPYSHYNTGTRQSATSHPTCLMEELRLTYIPMDVPTQMHKECSPDTRVVEPMYAQLRRCKGELSFEVIKRRPTEHRETVIGHADT